MQVAKINALGTARVLDSVPGMTFPIDSFTDGANGRVAHVRDYRWTNIFRTFQVWSIPANGYELLDD